MTADAPLVSVIVPTRERRHLVTRAVTSALRQTHRDVEVIVVVDASTDGTEDAVAALGDDRVRLIVSDRPRGPAASRNAGIDAARGRVLAFLDDDDEWLPPKLEAQLPLLGGDVGVVYCPYLIGLGARVALHRTETPHGDVVVRLASGWAPAITSSVVVDRDVLGDLRFSTRLDGVEDIDMWLELAHRTRFAVEPRPLVVVEKAASGRVTLQLDARREAIARLEAKWTPILAQRGLGAAFARTCEQMALVATLAGGAQRSDIGRSLSTLAAVTRTPMPPRTRAAGVIRLVLGPASTAWIQRAWFLVAGVPRRRVTDERHAGM